MVWVIDAVFLPRLSLLLRLHLFHDRGKVGAPTAFLGTPPYTYSWAPAGTLDNSTIPNPTATPTTTTIYTVTITDAFGCTESDDTKIIVNQLPLVNQVGLAASYCEDDASVILTATPATGTFSGPGVTDNPGDFIEVYTGPPVAIPDASGYEAETAA